MKNKDRQDFVKTEYYKLWNDESKEESAKYSHDQVVAGAVLRNKKDHQIPHIDVFGE